MPQGSSFLATLGWMIAIPSGFLNLDDLALQFAGTDAGKRFIEAWKRARIIVDTGGGHSNGGTPTQTPAAPMGLKTNP